MQAPGRLASWLKSRHKVFRVDKEHVSLKPNFLRKYNPAEYGPPGFPTQDKSAAHAHAWSKRSAEDQRILHLEEKILNWLAIKDKVTTTEMAEFAYATHEELVPGTQTGYWLPFKIARKHIAYVKQASRRPLPFSNLVGVTQWQIGHSMISNQSLHLHICCCFSACCEPTLLQCNSGVSDFGVVCRALGCQHILPRAHTALPLEWLFA